jgi:hypothetical protein
MPDNTPKRPMYKRLNDEEKDHVLNQVKELMRADQEFRDSLEERRRLSVLANASKQNTEPSPDPSPPKKSVGMNKKQKSVLIIGLAILVYAGLFPPWQFVLHGPYGISASRRVGHFFSEPRFSDYRDEQHKSDPFFGSNPDWIEPKVDFQYLTIEWVTFLLAGGVLFWLSKSEKK